MVFGARRSLDLAIVTMYKLQHLSSAFAAIQRLNLLLVPNYLTDRPIAVNHRWASLLGAGNYLRRDMLVTARAVRTIIVWIYARHNYILF